jgi:polyvinyl alcohol dehydrogenase (cytochrome)
VLYSPPFILSVWQEVVVRKLWIIGIVVSEAIAGLAASMQPGATWLSAGRDLHNTRSQPDETLLNPGNVQSLAPAWVFEASGSVSATPAVEGGAIYFPDWGGRLYRLGAKREGGVVAGDLRAHRSSRISRATSVVCRRS